MKIGKAILEGSILFMSVYAGVKAYKFGTKEFEKTVPSAIDKVHMAGLVAEITNQSEDDN